MRLRLSKRACVGGTRKPERNGGERARKGEGGFSILETCVAFVVLMIVGLGMVSVFAYSIRNNAGAGDRALAGAVAQQRMEQLRNLPYTDTGLAATSTSGTSTVTTVGNCSTNCRHFKVTTVITDTSTTLKSIVVQVTPQDDNASWARSTVTLRSYRSKKY